MFDTVIVPLDGSAHAEVALPFALDEARHHGATIVLLHVIPRPEPCDNPALRSGRAPREAWSAEETDEAKRQAEHYLNHVAGRFPLGPKAVRRVLVGHPGHQIAIEACRYPRALIVLTRGESTLDSSQRSHVASYLMSSGRVPILAVGERAQDTGVDMVMPVSQFVEQQCN